ncbi:MAG: hypothetical protein GY816_22545, partial [Cytophagales bacterium]|nr:hypothetical protein [Cytophagales bacterium]
DYEDVLLQISELFESTNDALEFSRGTGAANYKFQITVGLNYAVKISPNLCNFLKILDPVLPAGSIHVTPKKWDYDLRRDLSYSGALLNFENLLVKQHLLIPQAPGLWNADQCTPRTSSLLDLDLFSVMGKKGWPMQGNDTLRLRPPYLTFVPVLPGLINSLSLSISHLSSQEVVTCEKRQIAFSISLVFRKRLMLTFE